MSGAPRRALLAGWASSFWGMLTLRLLGVVAIVFVLSVLIFGMMHLIPGDLVRNLLGLRPANEETIAATRQRFVGRRVVAIFEPCSYTAQLRQFQQPYREALGNADLTVVAPSEAVAVERAAPAESGWVSGSSAWALNLKTPTMFYIILP